jgi:hypothetical protein
MIAMIALIYHAYPAVKRAWRAGLLHWNLTRSALGARIDESHVAVLPYILRICMEYTVPKLRNYRVRRGMEVWSIEY